MISTNVAPLPRFRKLTFALPVELSPPEKAFAEPPIDPELKVILLTTSLISVAPIMSRSALSMTVNGTGESSDDRLIYEPVTTTSSILPSSAYTEVVGIKAKEEAIVAIPSH